MKANEPSKTTPISSKHLKPITSFTNEQHTLGELLYSPSKRETSLAIYQDKTTKIANRYEYGNVVYIPYDPHNPLLVHRVLRTPSGIGSYESTTQLTSAIRAFIHRFIELPKIYEDIAVHYVLLTWLYDRFNELPYLRVRGDFGTGKTRFLSVIGSLCYKPIVASGASTVAPLFHILHQIGGTLILDEADFRFSSETADITKILNNGNARGFPVMRCEMTSAKEFKPKAYTVFSPKIIATRHDYQDDALESRCITFDLDYGLRRKDIPLTLPADFESRATSLRNKLLTWRFDHFDASLDGAEHSDPALESRVNQIYAPLLALVKNHKIRESIVQFAKTHTEQARVDRGQKTEAELLGVIKHLSDNGDSLTISNITRGLINQYGTMYDRKITPKWVGGLIRLRLRLTTRKASYGQYIIAENQEAKLQRLYQRYDVTL